MTKTEKTEFRLFCMNATDSQLQNIIEKEKAAAPGSAYRKKCYEIARDVWRDRK